ncbi:hypothetical protein DVH24_039667 [Malus domestica]|uniref:Uncharacterized protein n=1 Tax=Malus domestica TaxID=3750 RepID=A0A498I2B0_MALDO|nr:hypothetical protein DVH24_039667 [Malus domestica]
MEKDTEIDSSYPPKTWDRLGKNCSTQASDAALEQHETHFGRKPNFNDEMGGFDIGVMVRGRETMKESVVTECRQKMGAPSFHTIATGEKP